jgi:O-methyltransferase involved in polyketide biosynthesis
VAAWLLRRHPKLLPTFAAPSILTMLRARSQIVDGMVADEIARAKAAGEALSYWSVGGGFDARWYRLRPQLTGIAGHHELEDPEVMAFKEEVLADSTFAGHWGEIRRDTAVERKWCIPPTDEPVLIVLEGVAVRLGVPRLRELLERLRGDVPRATILLDLPGMLQSQQVTGAALAVGTARARWTSAAATGAASLTRRQIHHLGWRVHDDVWMSARPELRAPSGVAICSGMEAFRVLRLKARDDV